MKPFGSGSPERLQGYLQSRIKRQAGLWIWLRCTLGRVRNKHLAANEVLAETERIVGKDGQQAIRT
jgi:hypothetical protein